MIAANCSCECRVVNTTLAGLSEKGTTVRTLYSQYITDAIQSASLLAGCAGTCHEKLPGRRRRSIYLLFSPRRNDPPRCTHADQSIRARTRVLVSHIAEISRCRKPRAVAEEGGRLWHDSVGSRHVYISVSAHERWCQLPNRCRNTHISSIV